MCGQHNEQMLMLVCMHDPCINCASIHLCTTQVPNSNVYKIIINRNMFVQDVVKLLNLMVVVLLNYKEFIAKSRYYI
jgi:hypothetical protein